MSDKILDYFKDVMDAMVRPLQGSGEALNGIREEILNLRSQLANKEKEIVELKEHIESSCIQNAYWTDIAGGYFTGGVSVLREAFSLLGWKDPHPYPAGRCDETGCKREAICGAPSPTGYRRTCIRHMPKSEGE